MDKVNRRMVYSLASEFERHAVSTLPYRQFSLCVLLAGRCSNNERPGSRFVKLLGDRPATLAVEDVDV